MRDFTSCWIPPRPHAPWLCMSCPQWLRSLNLAPPTFRPFILVPIVVAAANLHAHLCCDPSSGAQQSIAYEAHPREFCLPLDCARRQRVHHPMHVHSFCALEWCCLPVPPCISGAARPCFHICLARPPLLLRLLLVPTRGPGVCLPCSPLPSSPVRVDRRQAGCSVDPAWKAKWKGATVPWNHCAPNRSMSQVCPKSEFPRISLYSFIFSSLVQFWRFLLVPGHDPSVPVRKHWSSTNPNNTYHVLYESYH